jgi:hypothetical protein
MSATPNSLSTLKARLDQVIDRALAEKRIVGTVVLVSRNGELIYKQAAGFADREAGISTHEDTIFRLSSLTKPIVSATALAMIERGQLNLDDGVTRWIPEFQPALPDGTGPELTIRQLLNHTAGLGYGFLEPEDGPYHQAGVSDGLDQPGLSMQENLKRIGGQPLRDYAAGDDRYRFCTRRHNATGGPLCGWLPTPGAHGSFAGSWAGIWTWSHSLCTLPCFRSSLLSFGRVRNGGNSRRFLEIPRDVANRGKPHLIGSKCDSDDLGPDERARTWARHRVRLWTLNRSGPRTSSNTPVGRDVRLGWGLRAFVVCRSCETPDRSIADKHRHRRYVGTIPDADSKCSLRCPIVACIRDP